MSNFSVTLAIVVLAFLSGAIWYEGLYPHAMVRTSTVCALILAWLFIFIALMVHIWGPVGVLILFR